VYRNYLKRIFDIAVVVVLAPFVAPLAVLIAALIGFLMGRPVLFRQRRPGLHGRSFTILKFRTMRVPRDEDRSHDYDRLTPLGVLLRSTSLDELPQLWNVLRGEMSLVGPRPLLEEYLPYYTAGESRRHLVRPGITGWAQVHGRAILEAEPRLSMDVWYVDNLSWSVDLNIVLRTVWRVLARKDVHTPPADMGRNLFEHRQACPDVTRHSLHDQPL
jgi:lipopolysaccharide/colanic/teichoic acid biosynthesis glycosyltransferase